MAEDCPGSASLSSSADRPGRKDSSLKAGSVALFEWVLDAASGVRSKPGIGRRFMGNDKMGIHPTARIHERAIVESGEIGAETRVWAFAHVMGKARVGARCNLGEGVYVEEGAVIGDDCTIKNGVAVWEGVRLGNRVFVGPNAVFTNVVRPRAGQRDPSKSNFLPTLVQDGTTIGANATILCGVTIGKYAFIGAGSVVLRNVPAHGFVAGNPARFRGWVCQCAARLDETLACPECSLRFQQGPDGLVAV